jgi:Zn-dependent oligopeptidase
VTIDEELNMLDESVRRLKIEFDVYFGGGSKKPPAETEWKVKNLLRKYSDGARMNYAQRFRYTSIQQRYALHNALWQQKLLIKEEGYRRPQDAMLGIQGLRSTEEHAAEKALKQAHENSHEKPFTVAFSDVDKEAKKIEELFHALSEAKQKSGAEAGTNLASFKKFVAQKTSQLRKEYGCKAVEYSVEVQGGLVRLKAKPRS